MIFFVWSLVSSAIEAARKRHIANFLRALLQQQRASRNYEMLIWKTVRSSTLLKPRDNNGIGSRLYRPASEPKIESTLVLQTELIRVYTESFETLRASEWRFCPSLWPCDEDSIYFVVHDELIMPHLSTSKGYTQSENGIDQEEPIEPTFFKLHEKCDRLAIHKTMTRSLYACSFEMFVDVVDSFSEKLLIDEHFKVVQICSMFAPPQEIEKTNLRPDMTTSTLSLASTSHQRPLPILQHLFWGDATSQFLNDRYGSEGTLDSTDFLLSPSRQTRNPSCSSNSIMNRRRYRSCNSPGRNSPDHSNIMSFNGTGINTSEEYHSLPRYLRHLNFNQRDFATTPRNSIIRGTTSSEFGDTPQDYSNSLPRYIRQINQELSSEDISARSSNSGRVPPISDRQPTASDSYSSSFVEESEKAPTPTVEENNTEVVHNPPSLMKSHFTMDELRMIDETDTETIDSSRMIEEPKEKVMYASLAHRENGNSNGNGLIFVNGGVTIKLDVNEDSMNEKPNKLVRKPTPYPRNEPDPDPQDESNETISCLSSERNSNGQISDSSITEDVPLGKIVNNSLEKKPPPSPNKRENVKIPAIELPKLPPSMKGVKEAMARNKRSTSVIATCYMKSAQRRFSAFSNESDRGRSVSPSFEHYQNRSLRGFTSAANPNRNSTRRSSRKNLDFTPVREFFGARNKSHKAMAKPDSVLVYVGDEENIYSDIRNRLNSLLPPDEITVFNVSIEALRKQPWAEKSTVCVIIASTKDLDDRAWEKIQAYFNQNGKVIFVCQNKLLASVTGCDSSKEQASILRFAFGNMNNKLKENNKDFAKFLQKSLKNLPKTGEINETFRSKDVSIGANFTVVLKKEAESPLFLYMQNSGSLHASALFSDATAHQLIAPNSNLLRDSLKSVGVKVCENETPKLTKGILIAEYDSIIDGIAGLRLGEEIGTKPKILLRKSEIIAEQGLPDATNELLPIEVVKRADAAKLTGNDDGFDFDAYFDQLTTKMGQTVVGIDIATTTMDICDSLNNAIPSLNNIVVVANRQLKGKGRGGNEFISPKGSALFNCSFSIPKSSRFAKCIPILQHVFCVSLVEASRILSGYPDFPLRIKWPNDFYFDRSHKVGGLLISCNTRDDAFLISIGCGINVSNEKPTICLNDMLPNDAEKKFSKERLIAETLNRYQYYLNDFEQNGPETFRKKYYEYWLHSQQEVLLSDFDERVTIRGIDNYGYLQVRSKTNPDKIFSIGDDGNTFDMMKGLIRHKY